MEVSVQGVAGTISGTATDVSGGTVTEVVSNGITYERCPFSGYFYRKF